MQRGPADGANYRNPEHFFQFDRVSNEVYDDCILRFAPYVKDRLGLTRWGSHLRLGSQLTLATQSPKLPQYALSCKIDFLSYLRTQTPNT